MIEKITIEQTRTYVTSRQKRFERFNQRLIKTSAWATQRGLITRFENNYKMANDLKKGSSAYVYVVVDEDVPVNDLVDVLVDVVVVDDRGVAVPGQVDGVCRYPL